MTHAPEKSDLSKVARKPVNNSEGLEAEPVERREGAEGNTVKHGTSRTLDAGTPACPLKVELTLEDGVPPLVSRRGDGVVSCAARRIARHPSRFCTGACSHGGVSCPSNSP
jgi:hypothetical protein